MADEIKIDVCMASTDDERRELVKVSTLYWEKKGYKLLNNTIHPDSIEVYE